MIKSITERMLLTELLSYLTVFLMELLHFFIVESTFPDIIEALVPRRCDGNFRAGDMRQGTQVDSIYCDTQAVGKIKEAEAKENSVYV